MKIIVKKKSILSTDFSIQTEESLIFWCTKYIIDSAISNQFYII